MGGTLIEIVEQGRLGTILVHNVDTLAKSIRIMKAMMWIVIENTSFIMSIAAFLSNHIDIIVEEVNFEKELKQQFTKREMMQISRLQLSSMSPNFELCVPIPPERWASCN